MYSRNNTIYNVEEIEMLVNNLTSVQITDFAEDSQKGGSTRVEGEVVDVKVVDGAIEITLKGDNKGIICD